MLTLLVIIGIWFAVSALASPLIGVVLRRRIDPVATLGRGAVRRTAALARHAA